MVSNCLLLQTVSWTQCSCTYLLGHVCVRVAEVKMRFFSTWICISVFSEVRVSPPARPHQRLASSDVTFSWPNCERDSASISLCFSDRAGWECSCFMLMEFLLWRAHLYPLPIWLLSCLCLDFPLRIAWEVCNFFPTWLIRLYTTGLLYSFLTFLSQNCKHCVQFHRNICYVFCLLLSSIFQLLNWYNCNVH